MPGQRAASQWSPEPCFSSPPLPGARGRGLCCFRLGRCVGERDREIDDPEVVSFVDGRTDGSATFNPGVKALEVGDSDVTLTNSSTGQSVSFEVEVTAPR